MSDAIVRARIEDSTLIMDIRSVANNKKSGFRPTPGNLLFQEA